MTLHILLQLTFSRLLELLFPLHLYYITTPDKTEEAMAFTGSFITSFITSVLHDCQSHRTAVLFTLHNLSSCDSKSWICCGLYYMTDQQHHHYILSRKYTREGAQSHRGSLHKKLVGFFKLWPTIDILLKIGSSQACWQKSSQTYMALLLLCGEITTMHPQIMNRLCILKYLLHEYHHAPFNLNRNG